MVDLATRRRQLARDLEKLQTPLRQIDATAAALAELDDQIAAERAAQEAAERAERQRENEIALLWSRWRRLQDVAHMHEDVRAWLADCHRVYSQLTSLTGEEPERFTIEPVSCWQPIVEQEQRSAASMRAALMQDRATPAELEAYRRRAALIERLYTTRGSHDEARAIADLVDDAGLTEEQAIRRYAGAEDMEDDE